MTQKLMAIDISHWNTVTSFEKVRQAGVIGVFHKATEGTTYLDDKYYEREIEARAAGLGWGAYHFLKHGNVEQQMAFFLNMVQPPDGMRVAIDYEDAKCTLSDLQTAVRYLTQVAPALELAIYGGSLLKEHLGDSNNAILSPHALWLAQYTSGKPSWPKNTWPVWSLWQYSDGSVGGSPREVPGVQSPCDCNQFNGSAANCAKWFGLNTGPIPEPEPEPEPYVTKLDIGLSVTIAEDGTASAVVTRCEVIS